MVEPLNFFKALGIGIILTIICGWIAFMIYSFFNKVLKKLKYSFKKWKEEDVKFCNEAIEQSIDFKSIHKQMLLDKYPKKRIKDLTYLFNKCEKKMKGGKKNGRKY